MTRLITLYCAEKKHVIKTEITLCGKFVQNKKLQKKLKIILNHTSENVIPPKHSRDFIGNSAIFDKSK